MNKIIIFTAILISTQTLLNAQPSAKSIIEVTGEASVSKTPDALRITLSLNERKPDFPQAVNALTEKLKSIKTELEKNGITPESITTANYSVNENYKYTNGKSEPDGFQASVQINIEIYFRQQLMQSVYEAISKLGIKPAIHMQFFVKETEGISEDLRIAAVADARRKAQSLAAAAGVTLGGIQKISYAPAPRFDSPVMYKSSMRMDAAMEAPQLNPGEMEFRDAVFIVWEIK